ncbi:MAG: hypothetical protein JSW72_01265 [Candidatus Bathyarchaeota archaeon]|nr:MAG: hypothetical protein JSW72_01265 [Candidatus Bathyarchaeota archaeon]
MKCTQCSTDTYMPFKCPYCNQYFCAEHRLPENHSCPEYWRARAPKERPTRTFRPVGTEPTYDYTVTMMPQKLGRVITFSSIEFKHLSIGVLLVFCVGVSMFLFGVSLTSGLLLALILTSSFLIHEIAHKIAAQRQGLWAEFRLTPTGALITLISILLPLFKVISPGAVMIAGVGSKETIGKTAIAGPSTNMVLATTFLAVGFISNFFKLNPSMVFFGAWINSFIAIFNLIPFGIMDGFKIFSWNKPIWGVSFSASIVLAITSFLLV